ncbi:single-stranded DNA-binding protein [Candidatus Peregrinibacteria bacterium]|nr:single-stranded DNA-binding protein [Candidatus Peregrinibacteria bacterium]
MKSVNTVTLLGNVTHNPEVKSTPEGRAVCTFGVATNRFWKDAKGAKKSQAEFHNLVAFGKLGDVCGKYLKKGKPVYVQGHLKTDAWEKPEGTKHRRTEIVVENLVLLGAKKGAPEIEKAVSEEAVVA